MLFLSEIPVFFLMAPNKYIGIAATLLILSAVCVLAVKFDLYRHKRPDLFAVLTAVLLGVFFVLRWMPSNAVGAVAEKLRLSPKTLLVIAGALLSAASVPGILNLIAILKGFAARMTERDTEIGERAFYKWYAVILLLCAVFYGALLGGRYVWLDEAYSFAMAKHSFAEIWTITAADSHPPLYYFILKLLTQPFDYSLLSAKIASVLPYLFILAFGGMQFKKLFGRKSALLFMILFFLFPFAMDYAIEVRMYSYAAAFVFGNAVYAYRCYTEERKSNWIAFSLFGVCSAYTHYFALVSTGIVYGILLLFILLKKRAKILPWCLASLLTAALYIPWLKCFIGQLIYKANNSYWIPKITVKTLIDYFKSVFGSHTSTPIAVLVSFTYLLALIDCVKSGNKADTALSVCLISVPLGTVLIGILASIAVRPVFVIRYAVPAIPLLIVFLIVSTNRKSGVRLYVIMASVLAGAIGCTALLQSEYAVTKNALDSAFIEQHSTAQCYVVTADTYHIPGVLSYYDPVKPIFSVSDFSGPSPFPNIYSVEAFDASEYTEVLLFTKVGESPSGEILNGCQCEYIGKINECGNVADAYRLTR